MQRQKHIKESFFKSMVPCHCAFQELLAKGMDLGKMEVTQVIKKEGKTTTKGGGSGMATEGAAAEGQIAVIVENRMVKGMVLGKMEAMQAIKEEGKTTTKVGGSGMATEGVAAEGQVAVIVEDRMVKGMDLGKMEAMQVIKEEGKTTTKVGGTGMATEGVAAEGQVAVAVEDRMVMKVAHRVILNKTEMEETKVVEGTGVAKAEAHGKIKAVVEKDTAVAPVEDLIQEVARLDTEDVDVKTEDKEGIFKLT